MSNSLRVPMSSAHLQALSEDRLSTFEMGGQKCSITGTEAAASLRRLDPQLLVGKRVDVMGRGPGRVQSAIHSLGKATRHKVEFDDGTKAILLLQKKGVTDTRRVEFELLEEAGADGIVAGGAQVSANRMTRQAIAKAKSMPDKQAAKPLPAAGKALFRSISNAPLRTAPFLYQVVPSSKGLWGGSALKGDSVITTDACSTLQYNSQDRRANRGRQPATSAILNHEWQVAIQSMLPKPHREKAWQKLYTTDDHGASTRTMFSRTAHHDLTIVVALTEHGEVVGGFADQRWHAGGSTHGSFYGGSGTFLFKGIADDPTACSCVKYEQTGRNTEILNASTEHIAFGGGGAWALYLGGGDFTQCSSETSPTFDNEPLSKTHMFECEVLEVWGLNVQLFF